MGEQQKATEKPERGGRRGTRPGPGAWSETRREGAVRKKAEEGPSAGAPGIGATLLRVAWLAVLLGLAMEALLVALALGFGSLPGAGPAVADLVRQVSWSVFVCVGLAIGTAASKLRVPLMGVLGLLAAPSAFAVARVLHQSAAEALKVSGTVVSSSDASLVLIALLKGVEYGCLGVVVGWVGRRAWGGALAHVGAGLAVGILFGGAIVSLTYSAAAEPLPAARVVSQGVNEVLFPVGCALVLFVAAAVARWNAEREEQQQQQQQGAPPST